MKYILGVVLAVLASSAQAGWVGGGGGGGGGVRYSHPTDCPNAGFVASPLEACVQQNNGNIYTCKTAPNLGVDPTKCDIAGDWLLGSASASAGVTTWNTRSGVVSPATGDYTATQITNTATGTIGSTNLQAVLTEIVAEFQPLDTDLTQLAGLVCTTNQIHKWNGSAWVCGSDVDTVGVATFNTRSGTVVSASGDYTATQIVNVPGVSVTATDVQAAINQLDTGKQPLIANPNPCPAGTYVSDTASDGSLTCTQVQAGQVSAVPSVPNAIAGTTVQAQLDELGTERQIGDSDLTQIAGLACTDQQIIKKSGTTWVCSTDTVGVLSFNTRTGAVVPASGDYTAAQITTTTTGGLSSPNVQAMMAEIETEKQQQDPDLSQIAGLVCADTQIMKKSSGNWVCAADSGGVGAGDVGGPASATDNAIARFDSTTGKLIQNSSVIIDDSGNISTAGTLASGAGSSNAGVLTLTAGIAPSAAAATTLQIHAPATVTTPYNFVMPSVPGTGVLKVSSTAGITTATMAAITDADIPNTGITLSDYQPIDPDLTTVAGLTCGTGLVLKSTGTSGSNTLWSCGSDLTGAGSGAGDVDGISAATGCVSATGNDSYACTMTPAITAYANNTRYVIKAGTPNTGPATLQLNSIAGPKAIVKIVNDVKTPLVTGDVQDEMWMGLAYDGTDMILLNPTPNIQNAYNLGGTTPSITVGANGWRIMDLTSPTKAFYLCGDTTCTIYQRRYYDTGNSTWVTETVPTSDMVMTIPSTKNWIVEQSGGADLLKVTEAGVFTAEPATTVDFGSAAITKPSKFGTTPPGSCTTGETFLDTDAAVSAMWLGCSGGTFQVIGGGGGGGTVTAPVTLTPPTADIPNTLTIQNFATTNLLRIGTLIGTPTYGSVYFGPGTPTATNYGIAGDGADLYLNGPTSTNLGSGGVWKVKVVSSGVNVSSISFPENSPDVGLSRVSANVLEVRTATAGQNAPLITGFRDGGTTTVGTGLTIRRQSTGTPAAGLGSSLLYQLNSSSTANQDAARMDAVWTDATHATRSAALVANVVSNGTFVQSGRWLPSGLEVPRLTGVATGTDGTCNTGEYWIRANSSETQWKKCQNGTISALDTFGSGGTPAGSTTQLQYNNSGVFGGVGAATWNGTVLTLTSPAVIGGVDLTPNDTKTCTAGSYSVFADTSETALKGCNNGTAGEIEFVDTPSTLTNKTIDATDATNVLTTTSKVWLPAASCQAGVANLLWDVEATNVPTAVCAPDSLGVQKGVADFEQTPESCLQTTIMLPADFALPLDVRYVWYSPVISGNVAFCSQLISNGDGEVDDVAFPAQASGNCIADTTKPTSLQLNYADDPAVTATGVAAGRLLHIRMCRNVDDTGGVVDDLVGKVRFIGAEFTFRRVQ